MKRIVLMIAILLLGGCGSGSRYLEKLKGHQRKYDGTEIYRESQLEGLPAPVQRYFRHVLTEGQPCVSSVKLTHGGTFRAKLDGGFSKIRGTQYFTADEPGFLWTGKTALFRADDMYLSGEGRLVVRLLSCLKIVDAGGAKATQGELLRWLGESVWFPTNLLPSDRLQWLPVDEHHARCVLTHNKLTVDYLVTFSQEDEIVELETLRYMGEGKKERWIGRCGDYREVGGMRVPFHITASWILNGSEKKYVDFDVKSIEFDIL